MNCLCSFCFIALLWRVNYSPETVLLEECEFSWYTGV
jgi:hypothetical protein